MKKLFIVALAIGMMTSCGYQSIDEPLPGTDYVISSAKVEGRVVYGVKDALGNEIISPQFIAKPAFKNSTLLGQKGSYLYLYGKDGALLCSSGFLNINRERPDYFTARDSTTNYLIFPAAKAVISGYAKAVVGPDEVLHKTGDLCGVKDKSGKDLVPAEYESILKVSQDKDYFYLAKVNGKAQWKKIGADGKVLKNLSKWQVDRIKADAKKSGYAFGDENLGGVSVKNLKSY